MRKILENTITILAELLILGLCIVWYIQSKEIEPLVGIVASGAALLSSLAMRFFPEKEEEKQQETLVNKTTIKEKTNVVEKSKIKGHDVIIGSGSNITKIKKQIIRYDQGHEIPRIISPTTPMYPQYFIGRETKLTEIHTRLHEEDHFLLLVNGNGGMGKTTIASRYFFDYEEDFQHLAWVFCEEKIADALLTLSPALGLKFEKEQEEERLSLLFHKLSNLKKPSLLIIDNANEDTDVDLFYPRLAALPNLKVIFTSRVTDLNDIPQIRIGELSEEKTLELFKHYYSDLKTEEEATVLAIRQAVHANTLVLELLARNLNQLNRRPGKTYSLDELLKDLQEKGLLQIQKTKVKAAYRKYQPADPEEIITAMYDLSELDEAETNWLAVLASLPAESILYSDLEKLLDISETQVDALMRLTQLGWLEYSDEQESFKCSPVVQAVIKRKHTQLQETLKSLIKGLIKNLHRDVLHLDNYRHSSLFVRYAESLIQVLPTTVEDDIATLYQNIGNYYTHTGDLPLAMEAFQFMEDTSTTLTEQEPDNPDFKNGLAISYAKLGETHSAMGNLDQALTFFDDETILFQELYEAYPQHVSFKNGLAISYSKLGSTHSAMGNLDQALTFFDQRSRLGKELYEAYPQNVSFKNGLAISYEKLGSTHSAMGNLDQALTYYEKGLALTKELYEAYPQHVSFKNGLAISYAKLGDTHSAMGNLDQALTFFDDFSLLMKELYEAYPQNVSFKNSLAISYEKLGETHSAMGNLDQALTFFDQRSRLGKELYEAFPQHVSFKNGLAISYEKLGKTHSALGNLNQALTFFDDETILFQELYEAYPQNVSFKNGLAISYAKLAQFYRDNQKGNKQARDYFKQAEALWIELVQDAPQYVEYQKNLETVRNALKTL